MQCASSPLWLTDSGIVIHTSYLLLMLSFYRTHQHPRSQNASKVKDLLCDVVALHRLSAREEEQDVTQHTHYRQRHQSDPQTLGKAARTHSDTDASASSTTNNSLSFLVGFKTLLKLMFQVTLDWILSSFCPLQVGEVLNFEMPNSSPPVAFIFISNCSLSTPPNNFPLHLLSLGVSSKSSVHFTEISEWPSRLHLSCFLGWLML